MLIDKDNSCLLLIDVQEKLTPHVLEPEALVSRCAWLLRLAQKVGVSVYVSEQYPQGLGATVAALKSPYVPLTKVHFSCWQDSACQVALKAAHKKQFILMGIETHVCVMQTALDLIKAGYEVFVVVDAVSSRHMLDHKYALKRMKQASIQLVTSEMVFFEWLKQAGTPEFKALSKAYL